jgi:protein-tyrosine phosphatase
MFKVINTLTLLKLLFFKKSKPVLKDLIPTNYIDIHSHLLFGIDDGAKSFEDTLSLTNSLLDIGFSGFITTPHTIKDVWNNTRESILSKSAETIQLLKQNNITVQFESASEYMIDENFNKQFQTEDLLTLKDNYVLVEMSYLNAPLNLYNILFDLQIAGYKPILAHPERYLFYHQNFQEYYRLKKAGCLFQLNLLSAVGYYGEAVFQVSKKLLSSGLIDYVGSDLHHERHFQAFNGKTNLTDLQPLKEAFSNNQFFQK